MKKERSLCGPESVSKKSHEPHIRKQMQIWLKGKRYNFNKNDRMSLFFFFKIRASLALTCLLQETEHTSFYREMRPITKIKLKMMGILHIIWAGLVRRLKLIWA